MSEATWVISGDVVGDVRRALDKSELSPRDVRDLKNEYMRDYYKRPGVKEMYKARHRKWYVRGGKEVIAAKSIRRNYGLSPAEYEAMLAAQGGLCAMECDRPAVCVDHDHATGKVRGLLCRGCNVGLGFYERLRGGRADRYLERTK